jgi:hypothetical protein
MLLHLGRQGGKRLRVADGSQMRALRLIQDSLPALDLRSSLAFAPVAAHQAVLRALSFNNNLTAAFSP